MSSYIMSRSCDAVVSSTSLIRMSAMFLFSVVNYKVRDRVMSTGNFGITFRTSMSPCLIEIAETRERKRLQ